MLDVSVERIESPAEICSGIESEVRNSEKGREPSASNGACVAPVLVARFWPN